MRSPSDSPPSAEGTIAGMMAGAAIAAASEAPCGERRIEPRNWLALSALIFYIIMYAVSPGMLGFLMISEISPLRARAKVTSLSIFVIFATNLVIALLSLPMLNGLGVSETFWIFSAICVAFTLFSFFVPETKGKSLEEVEFYFKEKYCRANDKSNAVTKEY